jgi:benzoylformate decarboxylase
VKRILSAERPVIIVGDEIVKSDALEEAARFASVLGCAVHQQTIAYGAHFLSEHPGYMGPLSRIQKQTSDILSAFDLMIVLGADPVRMSVFSEHAPLPNDMPMVQIGLVDRDLAKNFPAEIALKADVRETLCLLTPALSSAGGEALSRRAQARTAELQSKNWSARRKTLVEQIAQKRASVPIDPDWLALRVVEAMPSRAILVDEGLTASRYIPFLRAHRDRYGYHALASGGIGWGLPASIGVSLANPDRPVVCYSGDGSAMYSIQSLWTAAHHKLPLNVVIVNNGGYRIIKQRLLAFHQDDHFVGMDFADPAVDFTSIARGLGLEAIRIDTPEGLDVLPSAFERPGPKLIEVMVDTSV